MQMYDGAFAQLKGSGTAWSLSGKTFRLLLLEKGPVTFDSTDATVTAVLANARNTDEDSSIREEVTVTTEVNDYGLRSHLYRVTQDLNIPTIRQHGGSAVIYVAGSTDTLSYPIGMIKGQELLQLVNGEGLYVTLPILESIESRVATAETDIDSAETDIDDLEAGNVVLRNGGLAISAGDATQFKTTNTWYATFGGIQFSNVAEDSLTFTANHTVNTGTATGDFFGAILVQSLEDGTISTKVVSADQVYTTSAAAIAALPAADALNVALGYIVIAANSDSAWTANTDDMTDASDVLTATFVDYGTDAPA